MGKGRKKILYRSLWKDLNGGNMKVVTMGEMMARFMPKGNLRLEQVNEMEVYYGGDESIVATSLARFGAESMYLTKLPENILGDICIQKLRMMGVDTSCIVRGGERLGLNFYENGASVRPSVVLYDRKNSAISEASVMEFDFEKAFDGADWFHFAGITPAISKNAAELTLAAAKYASEHGITVSCDLNYRSKLWSIENAREVMIPLMQYVDVLFGGIEDADKMLKLEYSVGNGKFSHDEAEYQIVFEELKRRFHLKMICSTMRQGLDSSNNSWAAILYDGEKYYITKRYDVHLVDRGGSGASFAAAVIWAVLSGYKLSEIGEFAVAASALKQTIMGDYNLVTLEEVKSMLDGETAGRVNR